MDVQTSLHQTQRILDISRDLISALSLDTVLHKIIHAALELTGSESAGILLFDEALDALRFVALTSHEDQLLDVLVPIDCSIAGASFASGEPLVVSDVRGDPRYYARLEQATGFQARSLLVAPLQFKGHKIGVLKVENKRIGQFEPADVEMLTVLAAQATVLIENAQLYAQLRQELSTRAQMEDELRQHRDHLQGLVAARTAELAAGEARHRELAEQMALIMDNLPALIAYIDADERYLYVNRVYAEWYGRTPQELVGRRVRAVLPEDMYQQVSAYYPDVLAGHPVAFEGIAYDKNNQVRFVNVHYVPHVDAQGRVPAFLALIQDTTEHQEAQERLWQQQNLLAVMEERDRIGRELHDGLSQVLGFINIQTEAARALIEAGQVEPATQTLAQLAHAARAAQADLRHYILGIRAPAAAANADWVANLQAFLADLAERYGVEGHLTLPPGLDSRPIAPEIVAELLGIIREALNNVRKHAGVNTAQIVFVQEANTLQVIIADSGRGFAIPPPPLPMWANAAAPLTLASQEPAAEQHFGLAIMQERAIAVGGTLDVRSAPGQGTQVIVRVPLAHLPAQPPPAPEERVTAAASARGLRVVLVDDHPLFLDGMRNMLTAYGAHVVGLGCDGTEACGLAEQLKPDLILMDIHMPRMDGLEATRRIKARLPDIKIVILTMAAEDDLLFEALQAGASGYLLKSMDSAQFYDLLTGVVRGETVLSPALATRTLAELMRHAVARHSQAGAPEGRPETHSLTGLTPRQNEILERVTRGQTYKEIAAALSLSETTIKYHMGQILEQLHVKSRREAILFARQMGLGASER